MGTLTKELLKYFNTNDLYELFNIPKTATDEDLKRAYRKISLAVHPDRVAEEDKESATVKFQVVGKAYSILSDKQKRRRYDRNGVVDDELVSDTDRDWYAYYRDMFPEVTTEDIDAFIQEYTGSEEEQNDLLVYYERFKGDMDKIMECLMGYDFQREEHFHTIINQAIKDGKVKDYKTFTKEDPKKKERRRKRLEKEAKAAEKITKKRDTEKAGGDDGMAELRKAILDRQEARGANFLDKIEEKYAKNGAKKNKKSASDEEWDDEEDLLPGDNCDDSDDEKPKKSKKGSAKSKGASGRPAPKKRRKV
ncbi:dnaJ homolog subfamily C member 9-like [Paramacrobiotus metropolitanus]|uniref:dnaJ homolog subfamily C member 9-like n=1 Tax=Paramacrobiotus metropolitanus TaxID=2943436 RepID=UPI0024455E8F|nr:dnaJ homolog subfamily C member 9-like [Paramacrobiotus metropolitanus]